MVSGWAGKPALPKAINQKGKTMDDKEFLEITDTEFLEVFYTTLLDVRNCEKEVLSYAKTLSDLEESQALCYAYSFRFLSH